MIYLVLIVNQSIAYVTGASSGHTEKKRPHPSRVSLARARPFSLSPTTSKRLLHRLTKVHFYSILTFLQRPVD